MRHVRRHDPAVRRNPGPALPDRQRRADRGVLRSLDLLRAAPPELVRPARLVLPVLRQRLLPTPGPGGGRWVTATFMHGSWDHILGNMLFLAIFGKNVE